MNIPDTIERIPFNFGKPDCPKLSEGDILEAVIVEPAWEDVDLIGRKIYFHVYTTYNNDPMLMQIYSPEDWEIGNAFLELSNKGYLKYFPWRDDSSDENANLIQVGGNWPLRTRTMRFFLLKNYRHENYRKTKDSPDSTDCRTSELEGQ